MDYIVLTATGTDNTNLSTEKKKKKKKKKKKLTGTCNIVNVQYDTPVRLWLIWLSRLQGWNNVLTFGFGGEAWWVAHRYMTDPWLRGKKPEIVNVG